MSLLFIGILFLLNAYKSQYSDKFLPLLPSILLVLATLINQLVFSLAAYLRCHKQEPLLLYSIVLGIITAASTFFLVRAFGVLGLTWGYSLITIFISLPWVTVIFNIKKKIWHN